MVILVVILLLFRVVDVGRTSTSTVSFTEFMEMVKKGDLDRVTIRGQEIRGFKKGSPEGREPGVRTYAPTTSRASPTSTTDRTWPTRPAAPSRSPGSRT